MDRLCQMCIKYLMFIVYVYTYSSGKTASLDTKRITENGAQALSYNFESLLYRNGINNQLKSMKSFGIAFIRRGAVSYGNDGDDYKMYENNEKDERDESKVLEVMERTFSAS